MEPVTVALGELYTELGGRIYLGLFVFGMGRGNAFFSHGERQLQLQNRLTTEGHGGSRRTATATATPFVHGGPRRITENGNCNGNTFCPRRATEDHGERQLQRQRLLSTEGHSGPRRTATATATPFVHGGPQRATENGNCTGKTSCPRRATENTFSQLGGPAPSVAARRRVYWCFRRGVGGS